MEWCWYPSSKRLNLLKCFYDTMEFSLTLFRHQSDSIQCQGEAVWNYWENYCTWQLLEFLLPTEWSVVISWIYSGKGYLSFIQTLLGEPRIALQAILFHEITDLTELSFSDHMVIVKTHFVICRSESQRASVALACKQFIHIVRLFSSAWCSLVFTGLCIRKHLNENTPEDGRDRCKSHSQ